MNIIEEDTVRFTNLSNGQVFKHAGNIYMKMQNVDIERRGNINCVNLKNGDYGHVKTDKVIQRLEVELKVK